MCFAIKGSGGPSAPVALFRDGQQLEHGVDYLQIGDTFFMPEQAVERLSWSKVRTHAGIDRTDIKRRTVLIDLVEVQP